MPDMTLRNGSTITIMLPDGTTRDVEAERITISSDAVPQIESNNTIYATSSSSNRLVSWDTSPATLSFNISDEDRARVHDELMRSATLEWQRAYSSSTETTSRNNETKYINSYNYVPDKFNFYKLSNEDELYMGVELEIDCGGEDNDIAKQVIDIVNKKAEIVYCKHDGSLRDGFEIVSHPCTYEYYKTIGYEKLFKFLVGKGYKSHDVSTCGMHVHINRNYFGDNKLTQDLCISKFLYIFEKFWDKVEIVARRKSNGYAKRFYLNDDESPIDLYVKSKDATKYGAINLQHKNTIEIRIFKGTLKYETFLYTLEFVKKIAKLVKDTDIYDIQYVTWDRITALFSDELNQYIVEREEQQKKEDKEKASEIVTEYRRVNNDMMYSAEEASNALQRAMMSFNTDFGSLSSSLASVGVSTSNITTAVNSSNIVVNDEEQTLLRQIQGRRQLVRRSRNGLEITNLNRQIADLENQLRRLRLNRR